MTIGACFWIIMLLWFLFGIYWNRSELSGPGWNLGGHGLLFILLFLLGWKVFGFPIQG
jgi:hypothetical protein